MGEVTKLTGIEPHVLRSWEKKYPDLRPKKNSAGNRVYREHEVTLIFKIKELLEEKKYTSEGVLEALNTTGVTRRTGSLPAEVKKDLAEIRVFLHNLLEKL